MYCTEGLKRFARGLFWFACLAQWGHAVATEPGTGTAYEFVEVNAAADEVWDLLDDFDEVERWNPAVVATRILRGSGKDVGTIRQLQFQSGARANQELIRLDPVLMRKEWQLLGWTELALEEYRSSISVIEMDERRSMVVWQSRFVYKEWLRPEQQGPAAKTVSEMYHLGLVRLKALAENPSRR